MISKSIMQDAVETDGDKYSVVLENERVRVLRYHDKPGDRTSQHAHPDYVLYAESSFKRRLTFPDGRKQEVDVKAGSVVWMKGHIHIGENIGDTNTDVIIVELKENKTLDKTETFELKDRRKEELPISKTLAGNRTSCPFIY